MMLNQPELVSLQSIRDSGPISSRNTSKGALLQEIYQIFHSVADTAFKIEDVRDHILKHNIIHKTSYATRRKVWAAIKHRYLAVAPQWVGRALVEATAQGVQSPDFLSLAYLYYALRDRATYEFVTGPVWEQWQAGRTNIDRTDFAAFLATLAETEPQISKWRETTRVRLGQMTLAALRDFGLLRGTQIKHIQRPPVAPETVFHLLCILFAEGKAGRAIVAAPDWRLFLWSETEVANALNELAQKRWIDFERGGQTVIVRLLRRPILGGNGDRQPGEAEA